MPTIKGKLLAVNESSFKSKEGSNVEFVQAFVRIAGNLFALRVKSGVDLKPHVDKDVTLECELFSFGGKAADIRVVGIK